MSVSFRVLVPVQSEYTISPVFHLLLYVKEVDRDPCVNLRDRQRVDFREYGHTTERPCMNILSSIFFRVSFGTYFIFGVKLNKVNVLYVCNSNSPHYSQKIGVRNLLKENHYVFHRRKDTHLKDENIKFSPFPQQRLTITV